MSLRAGLEHPRYEIIPMRGVEEQLEYLPEEATITVTCSPKQGINATIELAEKVAWYGHEVVPHLAARSMESEQQLDEVLSRMTIAGIKQAFIVGGDAEKPAGPYANSLELMSAIKERQPEMQLGGTAYPESHPNISREALMQDLLERQQYMGYVTTQMCFDNDKILNWIDEIRAQGVDLPVTVGLPGVIELPRLLKVSRRVGIGDSISFLSKNKDKAMKLLFGQHNPCEQMNQLAPYIDNDHYQLNGFHIYTFNNVQQTEAWRQEKLAQEPQPTQTEETLIA